MTPGRRTAASGTPFEVDVERDRQARGNWLLLLGGPVIWFAHFLLVYLVAEAGCTGDGPGLRAFDPPVPARLTLIATVAAAVGCLAFAAWARRRWAATRDGGGDGGALAFVSLLLALFFFASVLFVGSPALAFDC